MSDIFRQEYKALTESQKSWMNSFKEQAQALYDNFESSLDALPEADHRLMALAKTNLENAIMWAVKAVS